MLAKADFGLYFANSMTVTIGSVVLVLIAGAMAAWALSEYNFRGNTLLGLYHGHRHHGADPPGQRQHPAAHGRTCNLVNTLTALVLVYTAQGLPLAIFILAEFMQQIPRDLRDAARCDGISEYRIFWSVILPLVRPAIATVAVFTMVPIWNDLWFPLILAPGQWQADHHAWACSSSSANTSPTGTR